MISEYTKLEKEYGLSENDNINKLICNAQNGDQKSVEELLLRYKYLVKKHTSKYYIKGSEMDDIVQEAMIGLYEAIKNYKFNIKVPFESFSSICINRRLISFLKSSVRQKHILHLNALLLSTPYPDYKNGESLQEYLKDEKANSPENELLSKENIKEIKKRMANLLTPFEYTAIQLYYDGFSYKEIANILSKNYKSIDATIYKAKLKLKKCKICFKNEGLV